MKTLLTTLLVCTITMTTASQTTDSLHQPSRRKTQLSFSFSLQNVSVGGSESSTSFLLAPRIGFFVTEGLQIEPEGVLLLSTGDPAYMINGNLVYNFPSSGSGVPFLLAGYGVANTVPVFNLPFYSSKMAVGVLNLGAGIKFFLTESVAFRAEYRYQYFVGEDKRINFLYYSYSQRTDARIHSFQFGILVAP